MKINYPIKYAAMPIIEQVGWTHGLHQLEREYDVVCYIVSKCYLISDLTKYTSNGSKNQEYEVVFPYQETEFNRWQRIIPEYNFMNGSCINSNKVDLVFETYEDALKHSITKNKNLIIKNLKYISLSSIQQTKEEFETKLAEYKELEHKILSYTYDLEIGENKKLNGVIKIENNNGKISTFSIYEVLKYYDKNKFVVYNITGEQFSNLEKLIHEGKTTDIKSLIAPTQALLINHPKDEFIKFAIEDPNGAYYIKNDLITFSYEIDKVSPSDYENIDEDTIIFYTTETMNDLLISYEIHPVIDLHQEKVNKIKKLIN